MRLFLLVFILSSFFGCVTTRRILSFESRPITILTLNFFNQRLSSEKEGVNSWMGDWVFRRERLQLIDEQLVQNKPDIFFIQSAMKKEGSFSESDLKILNFGSLTGYEILDEAVRTYEDTQEVESAAVAVSYPLVLGKKGKASDEKFSNLWTIGSDGYVLVTSVIYKSQPIVVVNVNIPREVQGKIWFEFIKDRINSEIAKPGRCMERIIVAGSLTNDLSLEPYRNFVQELKLADVTSGICQELSECYTASSKNTIFSSVYPAGGEFIQDRILVPQGAYIFESNRSFEGNLKLPSKMYELGYLWPSIRMGWKASVNLPRCP